MIRMKDICVSFRSERQDKIFGHTRQQVLFDISLSVKKGTCLGILGESGSGKSTMGRVLCGLLRPDSGEALLDGVSVYGSRAGRRTERSCRTSVSASRTHSTCRAGQRAVSASSGRRSSSYSSRTAA